MIFQAAFVYRLVWGEFRNFLTFVGSSGLVFTSDADSLKQSMEKRSIVLHRPLTGILIKDNASIRQEGGY